MARVYVKKEGAREGVEASLKAAVEAVK